MQRPMRHFCPMLQTVLRRKPLEICLLRLSTQDHYANLGCCNEWWYIRAILPNSQAHKNDHQCVQWSTGMASYCFLLQVSVESVLTLHDTYTFQNDSLQAFDFSSGLTSTTSTAVSYTEQSGNEWERERERERERYIYITSYDKRSGHNNGKHTPITYENYSTGCWKLVKIIMTRIEPLWHIKTYYHILWHIVTLGKWYCYTWNPWMPARWSFEIFLLI